MGDFGEKFSIFQVVALSACTFRRRPKCIHKTSKNNSKIYPKSLLKVIKRQLRKRVASQARQKLIFHIFQLRKGPPKSLAEITLSASGHHFSLQTASDTMLYRFGENLGAILDKFGTDLGYLLKHKTIQRTTPHHMTYVRTYMHTLRYDESTRPGGMREAIKSPRIPATTPWHPRRMFEIIKIVILVEF